MKQSSNMGEVKTWLVGIMTYKSEANTLGTHIYHTNKTTRDSQSNHQKRIQTFNQSVWWSVCKCALGWACFKVSQKITQNKIHKHKSYYM